MGLVYYEMETTTITQKGIDWIKEHGYDGHSIWKAEAVPFADLGLTEIDECNLTQWFESDTSDPKSTIFKDGAVVPKLRGVYSLTLVGAIANRLGVGNADCHLNGRGSRARALTAAILKALGDANPTS